MVQLTRVTLVVFSWVTQASGSGSPGAGHSQRPRALDSARVVREARAAQAEFEFRRRANLPLASEGSAGRCDARIGRYCYWHDDGIQPRRVEEPAAIIRARARLLETLDASARQLPSNSWIAGQRVRYWVDADHADSAIAAARACAADRWWCLALEGFALHEAARFAEADSVFDASIAGMPGQEKCDWTDLSVMLDGRAADRYDHASCEERQSLNERIWWVSQPFYSLGANDLRTEYYARMTMVRLCEHAAWPQNTAWGDDLQELIVRYGWPRWFTRAPGHDGATGAPTILGHDPEPSFAFIPDPRLVDSALSASEGDWQVSSHNARTNYAPAYAVAVNPMPHQVARFLRGDSALVAATYDVSGDTLLAREDLRAALVVAPDERSRFEAAAPHAGPTGALTVIGPRSAALVSIEVFAATTRASARSRFAVAPIDTGTRITLSDVLLYTPAPAAPVTLTDALAAARATSRVHADSALGLYWEVYGLRRGSEPLRVSLTIERTNPSWWLGVRRALHLTRADAPVALAWSEVPLVGNDGMAARAVSVDLSRLGAGRYRLRIEVRPEEGGKTVSERELELIR